MVDDPVPGVLEQNAKCQPRSEKHERFAAAHMGRMLSFAVVTGVVAQEKRSRISIGTAHRRV